MDNFDLFIKGQKMVFDSIRKMLGQPSFDEEISLRGADYPSTMLKKEIGELEGLEKCGACGGTGTEYMPNGQDDVNAEICRYCDGNGYLNAGLDVCDRWDARRSMGLRV